MDDGPDLRADPLDGHFGDAGMVVLVLDRLLHRQVFMDEPGVLRSLGEPARVPILVEPQPETVRMCLLSQGLSPFLFVEVNVDVARPLQDAEGPAHGGRPDPLPGRAFVHVDLRHDERVDVDRVAAAAHLRG